MKLQINAGLQQYIYILSTKYNIGKHIQTTKTTEKTKIKCLISIDFEEIIQDVLSNDINVNL